ncbi:putative thiol methyltransferase 2 [Smittium mucronatum]|uniref:Putative thiol methyltransferase 2 n=1 Tax=Smittium mucronatum TaxID=133383 RepID=A0A1R0H0C5_9FUNG|nr:putative thiol methyltransferase 2 [Smittium mucronatum]
MSTDREQYNQFWEEKWDTNTIFWDFGKMQIALKELIGGNKFHIPKGNCIVPGCGHGYDAIYFAQQGYKTVGLDVSISAKKAAEELAAKSNVPSGNLEFVTADFYTYEPPSSLFQVAYDYTFLSTVKPKDRELWGQKYADIISPGGYLITLIYPIDFGSSNDGPPFQLNIEMCHTALDKNFTLEYEDRDPAKEPPRETSCIMAVWKRK